jgi:hypothetical protein
MSRAFHIEIALDKAKPATTDVLLRFILSWAKFSRLDTPAILFLRIVTSDCESHENPDPRAEQLLSRLREGVRAATQLMPAWIDLKPLADCPDDHIDDWCIDLASKSFEIPPTLLDDVRRHLRRLLKREPDAFAFRDFLFAIESIPQ